MRRLLTALVFTLPLCLSACASYAVHLYSDPRLLQVIDERLVLTDADVVGADPLVVLMRGDSVVVIGERRGNWQYELDMHDREYVIYFNGHRSHVPYRSLVSREQYASMYGPGRQPSTPAATPPTTAAAATGSTPGRDSTAATVPTIGDPTGGGGRGRGRR